MPERRLSALPSVRARALAFAAILLAGGAGAAIGGSFASVSCQGSCDAAIGGGAIAGGAVGAGGTGVVAVLTLRAMGEWKRIKEEELMGPDHDGVSNRKPSA